MILISAFMSMSAYAQTPIKVTDGKVTQKGNTFKIESKSSRFELEGRGGDELAIHVQYNGPTDDTSHLASGSVVSQVALKLRSLNQCNLVYVSRRFGPKSEILIQTKENKGQSTHKECGDKGYTRIAAVAIPSAELGQEFSMVGSFKNDNLTVRYNGKTVWSGNVPSELAGNSGVRTDNAKVSIRLD